MGFENQGRDCRVSAARTTVEGALRVVTALMCVDNVQYDQSVGTFSPDGKIYQVEYALKAVESAG